MPIPRCFVFVIAMAFVGGAARAQKAPAPSDTTTHEYRGAYQVGFEKSWFSPCATPSDDKLWWVTLTDDALRQRDSLVASLPAQPTGALAVRWLGSVGPRMPAGQMGRGTRYLLVTRILDVKPLPADWNCGTI